MSTNLFADDSEDENLELKLNNEYVKSFNKFRQKELYQKLKEQDKNNSDYSSSSESELTDEEDETVNPKFDKEFFKTLSSLKNKDPTIYDKNTNFFEEEIEEINKNNETVPLKNKKLKKPLTIKDYERKVILEKGGKFEDDVDSDNNDNDYERQLFRSESPTLVDEQRKLKEEFKKVINADESDDEEFGGIFKKRQKTNVERVQEEEEYTKWLAGVKEDVDENTKKTLNPLKEYWNNPTLPKQEKFLRDYILNKGYIDKDDHEIPTYDQIVGNELNNFSEDENELERQAEFEHKYNFRFEEPDQEFIKRYPRTIENTVRKTDDSRKQKRLETKERKDREKEEKMKNLEMLKELKRQEILEKIKKLKEVTGNEELPFQENEFDDEFDPESHDRKMNEIFNDNYYGIEEDGEEKPECPDIDELKIDDWDNYDPSKDYDNDDYIPNCEDDDFNMDCDYNPNSKEIFQNELIESTKNKRKSRKKRNHFKDMLQKEKPIFNPEDEKSYEEYINEYYQMDCEDMIGDLPCRFKYVETVPNDFGLTVEEILLAKNKELNQWASLKKATQIRSEHVERNEKKIYQIKAQNEALKRKIFVSLYGTPSDEELEEEPNVNKDKESNTTPENNEIKIGKKKKKNKKRKNINSNEIVTKKIKLENEIENSKQKASTISSPTIQKTAIPLIKNNTTSEKITNNKTNLISSNSQKLITKPTKHLNKNTTKHLNTNPTVKLTTKVKIEMKPLPNINNPFKFNKNPIFAATQTAIGKNKKTDKLKFSKTTTTKSNKTKFIKKKNDLGLTDERLKAYGINPKKFNKKQNYLNMKNKNEKKMVEGKKKVHENNKKKQKV